MNLNNSERVELKYNNIERRFDSSILPRLETINVFYPEFHSGLFEFIPFRDFFDMYYKVYNSEK